MDGTVFAFFAAVCLGTGIMFGLAPALHAAKTDVNEVLKEGGRSGTAGVRARRWTGALMVAELVLTVVLLAGAGFMMRNFVTMYRLDLGIDTSHLLTTALALPDRKYPSLEQRLAFYERLEERLKSNPKIESVTITSNPPLQGGFLRKLDIEGKPLDPGPAGAERDDADHRSALLQDHGHAAAARPRPHRRRRHDRPRGGDHQSALRGAAFPERGSDRPPHHAVDRSAGRRAAAGRHSAVADGDHRRHRAESAPA